VQFTLDSMLALSADRTSPFGRRLRPDAIGMSGLSFGGFTALLATQREPRIRATLSLVPGGTNVLGPAPIAIPTMVIGAERDAIVGFAESERAFARLTGPRFLIEVLGANHLAAVDNCAGQCASQTVAQETAHRLILRYALPFFRRYLTNARSASRTLRREVGGVNLTSEPG
jgi:predicted dienelactone hydrolase